MIAPTIFESFFRNKTGNKTTKFKHEPDANEKKSQRYFEFFPHERFLRKVKQIETLDPVCSKEESDHKTFITGFKFNCFSFAESSKRYCGDIQVFGRKKDLVSNPRSETF